MESKFNYNELQVRTKTDNEEQVWFTGIDVGRILDYAKPANVIEKKLDDDEKKLEFITDENNQERKVWMVNEFGLYSLILSSKKPEAKQFKRWVTHEVLPAIRRAGKFTTEEQRGYEASLQQMASEIDELEARKNEHQKMVNELRKQVDHKSAELRALIKMDRNQLQIPYAEEE